MKQTLLSIICAFVFSTIYAQPNFTSSDMPNIGDVDTVRYLNYYGITNNLDSETGNGYSWDFSTLPFSTYPNFYTLDSFRVKQNIVSIPFVNATIEEYIYDGTAGDVNLFSYSNDTLYVHRLGSVLNGWPVSPPVASIVFPIQFNSTSSVTSKLYATSTIMVGERKTTTRYDGFGTLRMPDNKTYSNIFRVKKTERDSNYSNHAILTNTSYIWYKQGGQVPILRLTYTGSLNLYFVFGSKSNNTSTGINEVSSLLDINPYPNPSNGKFTLSGLKSISANIEIYNSTGEKVLEQKQTNEINISDQPKGVYFLRIYEGQTILTKKIIIQ